MSNHAKASQVSFVKRTRDFETSFSADDLKRLLLSPEPVLENFEVATSIHNAPTQPAYWSIFFDPENSSLKVYSNLPESLENKNSQKKMIHDANNLLSRLIMQLEYLKAESHSPETTEQIDGIFNTVDEIVSVLRKR